VVEESVEEVVKEMVEFKNGEFEVPTRYTTPTNVRTIMHPMQKPQIIAN